MVDEILDHIGNRVTVATITGFFGGSAYASYKGFPIVKTSASTAVSFALVSTACFVMERGANAILHKSSMLLLDDDNKAIDNNIYHGDDISSSIPTLSTIDPKLHYGSHALGGMMGGCVVGFLFQGKPLAGALLLTPIMLGIGKIELSLDEYRIKRLRQLVEDDLQHD
ncbi:hypothetical protein ACHAWU_006876 [Discostella pseudostelligera]|uniref:Uncharacterized protein n=1 Tax=Discostella pseudostelligera TaxID=259834 RepID=A0ABD3MY14_9STRA